jgi:hypothetical protein
MNPLVQLSRQVQHLFIALLLAGFAVAQSAQAVAPEPNEDDVIGNVAEENAAVAELGSDTVEAAMGQAANTPNKRVISINIKKPLQCAGGDVILRGNLMVTFKHTSLGVVQPTSLKFEGFTATAVSGNRKLVTKDLRGGGGLSVHHENGHGEGKFGIEFKVTGLGLPGGSPLRIRVIYSPNVYIFEEGEVKKLIPDARPTVRCITSP